MGWKKVYYYMFLILIGAQQKKLANIRNNIERKKLFHKSANDELTIFFSSVWDNKEIIAFTL